MKEFKGLLKTTLDEDYKTGLNTLTFHWVDYMVDEIKSCGCLEFLKASRSHSFSVLIWRAYRTISSSEAKVLWNPWFYIYKKTRGRKKAGSNRIGELISEQDREYI